MKLQLTFKTPDVVWDALQDIDQPFNADKEEEIQQICEKWIAHGEYVTIEIDTDTKVAIVLEE